MISRRNIKKKERRELNINPPTNSDKHISFDDTQLLFCEIIKSTIDEDAVKQRIYRPIPVHNVWCVIQVVHAEYRLHI